MIRKLFGYAALAVVGFVAINVAFKILGFALQLAWTLLVLAVLGFLLYLALKVVSPDAAEKVRQAVGGKAESESES